MGGVISSAKRVLRMKKEEMSILVLGLDAAGKTTILYMLRLGEVVTTIPTIGFVLENISVKSSSREINFTSWDAGGRDQIRPFWRHFFKDVTDQSALIFVLDSNDRERIEQAKDELEFLLAQDQLQGKPLLVFANKQDIPGAMPTSQVIEELGLHRLGARPWFVQASVAIKGDGLFEGLDWLSAAMNGHVAHASPEVASTVALAHSSAGTTSKGSDGESMADTASTADTEQVEENGVAVIT